MRMKGGTVGDGGKSRYKRAGMLLTLVWVTSFGVTSCKAQPQCQTINVVVGPWSLQLKRSTTTDERPVFRGIRGQTLMYLAHQAPLKSSHSKACPGEASGGYWTIDVEGSRTQFAVSDCARHPLDIDSDVEWEQIQRNDSSYRRRYTSIRPSIECVHSGSSGTYPRSPKNNKSSLRAPTSSLPKYEQQDERPTVSRTRVLGTSSISSGGGGDDDADFDGDGDDEDDDDFSGIYTANTEDDGDEDDDDNDDGDDDDDDDDDDLSLEALIGIGSLIVGILSLCTGYTIIHNHNGSHGTETTRRRRRKCCC